MKKLAFFSLILLLLCTAFPANPVSADGIIIPEPPPCPPNSPCPPLPRPISQLEIRYHHVTVDIHDQLAVTRVDQVFFNPNDWTVEGTYIFPLPAGAAVSNFTLWIDGQPVEGKVLPAAEARQIYQDIVNQLRDPALLEYIGRGAVQASIFPIPPGEERRVELEYSQILEIDQGLVQYIYPLNTEKFSLQPLKRFSVTVNVSSSQPVRAVYSPTHPIDIQRDGLHTFTASYEASQVLPDTDFTLYYSLGETPAFHLLSYRDPFDVDDPDGYFLLLLAPQPDARPEAVAKDLLLVLDRSGSMEGEKFVQAQAAVRYILNHLNAEDRFYLSAFSSGVVEFASTLRPASDAPQAISWTDRLSPGGSTDINLALLQAAAMADSSRPTYLIFLTDGLPTEGVVDSQQIIDNLAASAPPNLRLFTFGVGYDVDTFLLDTLAGEHLGLSTYVKPAEALDEILSGFYASISTPVLTDLRIDFGALSAYDLYPSPLPDLFSGSQLVILGRYRLGGTADLTLTGRVNDQEYTFSYPQVVFSADSRAESGPLSGLPRLWATRKVGYLLNLIRLKGPNQEIIDQIVRLSIRYGIVTPYTSYLVTEPMPLGSANQERLSAQAYQQYAAAPNEVSGAEAVEKALEQGQLSRADVAPVVPAAPGQTVRVVAARTFVQQDGIWIDTAYDPARMSPQKISFLSQQYFDLAGARADITAALALGPRVIVIIDGQAFEITTADHSPAEVQLPEPLEQPAGEPTPPPPPVVISATTSPSIDDQPRPALPGFCPGSYLPLLALAAWLLIRFPRMRT